MQLFFADRRKDWRAGLGHPLLVSRRTALDPDQPAVTRSTIRDSLLGHATRRSQAAASAA